jgi:hypothetical protein
MPSSSTPPLPPRVGSGSGDLRVEQLYESALAHEARLRKRASNRGRTAEGHHMAHPNATAHMDAAAAYAAAATAAGDARPSPLADGITPTDGSVASKQGFDLYESSDG